MIKFPRFFRNSQRKFEKNEKFQKIGTKYNKNTITNLASQPKQKKSSTRPSSSCSCPRKDAAAAAEEAVRPPGPPLPPLPPSPAAAVDEEVWLRDSKVVADIARQPFGEATITTS
jgi:hypothetical protein